MKRYLETFILIMCLIGARQAHSHNIEPTAIEYILTQTENGRNAASEFRKTFFVDVSDDLQWIKEFSSFIGSSPEPTAASIRQFLGQRLGALSSFMANSKKNDPLSNKVKLLLDRASLSFQIESVSGTTVNFRSPFDESLAFAIPGDKQAAQKIKEYIKVFSKEDTKDFESSAALRVTVDLLGEANYIVLNPPNENWQIEFKPTEATPLNSFATYIFEAFGKKVVFAPYLARMEGFSASVSKEALYLSDASLILLKKDPDILHELLHLQFQEWRASNYKSVYNGHITSKSMSSDQEHEFSFYALEELATYSLSLMLWAHQYGKSLTRAPNSPRTHWLKAKVLWTAYTLEIMSEGISTINQEMKKTLEKYGQEAIPNSIDKFAEWVLNSPRGQHITSPAAVGVKKADFDYVYAVDGIKLRFNKLDSSKSSLEDVLTFSDQLFHVTKNIQESSRRLRQTIQSGQPLTTAQVTASFHTALLYEGSAKGVKMRSVVMPETEPSCENLIAP